MRAAEKGMEMEGGEREVERESKGLNPLPLCTLLSGAVISEGEEKDMEKDRQGERERESERGRGGLQAHLYLSCWALRFGKDHRAVRRGKRGKRRNLKEEVKGQCFPRGRAIPLCLCKWTCLQAAGVELSSSGPGLAPGEQTSVSSLRLSSPSVCQLNLRLQLLDVENNPYLIKALYGLLMLLPQSQAFQLLSHRLRCVPNPELMRTLLCIKVVSLCCSDLCEKVIPPPGSQNRQQMLLGSANTRRCVECDSLLETGWVCPLDSQTLDIDPSFLFFSLSRDKLNENSVLPTVRVEELWGELFIPRESLCEGEEKQKGVRLFLLLHMFQELYICWPGVSCLGFVLLLFLQSLVLHIQHPLHINCQPGHKSELPPDSKPLESRRTTPSHVNYRELLQHFDRVQSKHLEARHQRAGRAEHPDRKLVLHRHSVLGHCGKPQTLLPICCSLWPKKVWEIEEVLHLFSALAHSSITLLLIVILGNCHTSLTPILSPGELSTHSHCSMHSIPHPSAPFPFDMHSVLMQY
ncbi:hypothetical protein JZ751_020934 [Albula glossodonta]|uniref:Vacuolar protein 14 C-terminal Fig4-binding domain-containing protein n=1 Tax=Albula glossodonta TaxID=121402 RepID=A0A8T2PJY4_9TELE|nr:hypothetical protein JZ751_020934 [Albula glossodonta]